ncbi:MAG: sodium:solute symporter, partial [Chryseobacterium sp.]
MISTTDLSITIIYLAVVLMIGLFSGRSKKKDFTASAKDYFLAGRSLKWHTIGLALFASNISCVHLVSLAQSGFDTGLLIGNFEWMAGFTLIILAVFFVPLYIKSGVVTLPDFLERRYDRSCRNWLTVVSIVSSVIIHISFPLLAGGVVLQSLFGINLYAGVIFMGAIAAVYTVSGGLRSVVITESLQTVVLLTGAVILTVISYQKIGGWDHLVEILRQNKSIDKLSMMRPKNDPDGIPWYSVLLGYP